MSSTSFIYEIQQTVCGILSASSCLSSVTFLAEDLKDIDFQLQKALKSQGIVGLVMTPTLSYRGTKEGTDTVFELNDFTVLVTENVQVNRMRRDCQTSQDVGFKVAQVLCSPAYGYYGMFSLVSIETGEDSGLLNTKVTFKTVASTDLSGTFDPPEHKTYHPFALSADVSAMLESIQLSGASKAYVDQSVQDLSGAVSSAYASKEWVDDQGYLTEHQSLTGYYTKSETSSAVEISSKLNELSGYYTKEETDEKLSEYALAEDVPYKTSQLENDSGYATSSWVEDQGYLTEHQSLTGYYTRTQTQSYVSISFSQKIKPISSFLSSELSATQDAVSAMQELIPEQASSQNQLADKSFVNSSITTNTAYFKGTYSSVAELPTSGVTNNDYAFVIRTDSVGQTYYDRYKYSSQTSAWAFEYSINNSGFTAVQYAAINSGMTSEKVASYDGHIASTSNPHSVTKGQIGLGNVDNTSDASKPVSDAAQAALDLKANSSEVYAKSELSTLAFSGEYEEGGTFSFNLVYKI